MTPTANVTTSRRPAGLVVEAAGQALVLHQAGTPTAALTRLAAALPAVPDTTTAVLAADPGFDRAGWTDVVTALRSHQRREVLLMRGTADPIRAQKLADWLESDLLIPSGRVLTVPDGSLFVVKPGRAGFWERYRPGTPAVTQTGPWYPEPPWSHLIPPTFMLAGDEIVTNLIPGGMWLRRPAGHVVSVGHIIYAMPPGPDPVLLVWSPGAKRPLRTEEIADVIATLPPALQEGMAMLSYDANTDSSLPLPRSVAHYLGKPIRQQTGLRLADGAGRTAVVAMELTKGPTWRPFAETLVHPPQPSRRPGILGVRAPAANLTVTDPGVYALTDAWSVEVIAAGLWLRPTECDTRRPQARLLPADAVACTLVIGEENYDLPRTVWSALERLVDGLPTDALRYLRLVLGDQVGRDGQRQLKEFAYSYNPPLRVEKLSLSGLTRRSSLRQAWRDLLRRPLKVPRRASTAPAVGAVAVSGAGIPSAASDSDPAASAEDSRPRGTAAPGRQDAPGHFAPSQSTETGYPPEPAARDGSRPFGVGAGRSAWDEAGPSGAERAYAGPGRSAWAEAAHSEGGGDPVVPDQSPWGGAGYSPNRWDKSLLDSPALAASAPTQLGRPQHAEGPSERPPNAAPAGESPPGEPIPGGLRFPSGSGPWIERPILAQLTDSPAMFVIEASVQPGGFVVDDAVLDGAAFAARIAAYSGYAGQPLLLLPPDPYPGDIADCDAIGVLARALDVRVTCSERPLWLVEGALFSADPLLCWEPRTTGPNEAGFLFPLAEPVVATSARHAAPEPLSQAAAPEQLSLAARPEQLYQTAGPESLSLAAGSMEQSATGVRIGAGRAWASGSGPPLVANSPEVSARTTPGGPARSTANGTPAAPDGLARAGNGPPSADHRAPTTGNGTPSSAHGAPTTVNRAPTVTQGPPTNVNGGSGAGGGGSSDRYGVAGASDAAGPLDRTGPAALRVPEWVPQPESQPLPLPVAAGRDHRSSPGERSRLRGLLSWRYDAHARTVTRLLAERPGLRQGPDDELIDDLVALCEFLTTDPAPYQAALRLGDFRDIDPALVSCAAGALRRLAALRSPVLCGGPDADDSRYHPGAVLTERGILGATTEAGTVLGTPVEYLIWSVTARRVDGMTEAARSAEVAFPAGTRLRVLDRQQTAGITRVLLADDLISEADDVRERVLHELRAFSQRRDDTVPVALSDAARRRLILRIGLTPAGDPLILPRTR